MATSQNEDRSQRAHVGYIRKCVCDACKDNPLRLLEHAARAFVGEFDDGNIELIHVDGCAEDDTCECTVITAFNDIARVVIGSLRNDG